MYLGVINIISQGHKIGTFDFIYSDITEIKFVLVTNNEILSSRLRHYSVSNVFTIKFSDFSKPKETWQAQVEVRMPNISAWPVTFLTLIVWFFVAANLTISTRGVNLELLIHSPVQDMYLCFNRSRLVGRRLVSSSLQSLETNA